MKVTTYLCLLLITLLLFATACERKLELPAAGEQKIVLLGELTAGDSIYIRAGQSTVIKSGATMSNELIQALRISVSDGSGNLWPLSSQQDDLTFSEYTLPFYSGQKINENSVYKITAIHDRMGTAEAAVTVPQFFDASITDTASVEYNGQACLRLQINIADNSGEHFYAMEVLQQAFTIEPAFFFNGQWLKQSEHLITYDSLINAGETPLEKMDTFATRQFSRVSVYTTDAQSEHLLNGNIAGLAKRILLRDQYFNGSNHQTTLYIPKAALAGQFPGQGQKTLVQVKSIAADYFRYLQGYEQYDIFSELSSIIAPVRITGNISNGVGMIGGVYKREFSYFFP